MSNKNRKNQKQNILEIMPFRTCKKGHVSVDTEKIKQVYRDRRDTNKIIEILHTCRDAADHLGVDNPMVSYGSKKTFVGSVFDLEQTIGEQIAKLAIYEYARSKMISPVHMRMAFNLTIETQAEINDRVRVLRKSSEPFVKLLSTLKTEPWK